MAPTLLACSNDLRGAVASNSIYAPHKPRPRYVRVVHMDMLRCFHGGRRMEPITYAGDGVAGPPVSNGVARRAARAWRLFDARAAAVYDTGGTATPHYCAAQSQLRDSTSCPLTLPHDAGRGTDWAGHGRGFKLGGRFPLPHVMVTCGQPGGVSWHLGCGGLCRRFAALGMQTMR